MAKQGTARFAQSPQNIRILGSWILRNDFENEEGEHWTQDFSVNKDNKFISISLHFLHQNLLSLILIRIK